MNFSSRLRQLLLSGSIEEYQFQSVLGDIRESNRTSVKIFSAISSFFLTVMVVLSFLQDALASNRLLYLVSAAAAILILLLSLGPAKKQPQLTLVLVYCLLAVLMFFGIMLGTVMSPTEITATYIALMLTTPQLFTDRPVRMYGMIAATNVVFVIMVLKFKDPITWNSDIVNACIFGSISCVLCTYMTKIKVERHYLVETVRVMAEVDQLTGLKNRHSYAMKLSSAQMLQANSIYCVYVDVNGLHELNNSQGHAAGDRMLQYIASAMQNIFGRDNTYRIGGDEYIALGIDETPQTIQAGMRKLRDAVEAAGYHIAIGMSHFNQSATTLDNIVKAAEQEMYTDKEAFYRASGIEHRRR